MRRPNLRIRVQLTVSVCLFTLICLVSLAIAIYVLSRETLLDLERGNLDLHSRMLREECRQEFSDIYQSFSRLSYSGPVRDIFTDYNNSKVPVESANLLHDSFGIDRILLMKLYLPNGTELLEIDSKYFSNRSGLPTNILPLSDPDLDTNSTLSTVKHDGGHFVGPIKAQKPIGGTDLMISLTLPINNETSSSGQQESEYNATIGYATFLINALRMQKILSSGNLSSSTSEVGSAALCASRNNYTIFDQLIPFNDDIDTYSINSTGYAKARSLGHQSTKRSSSISGLTHYLSTSSMSDNAFGNYPIKIPERMSNKLRKGRTPSAEYNQGPAKSMISISPFTMFESTYYVVVLEPHNEVFKMPHSLRNIVIYSSCIIGAAMIIFTFLFVSFGARQILRLKMAATYEQPVPSRWKFLPLPWWLRPSNPRKLPDTSEKGEMQVPEKVPLRKHVRDELDDITERFNAMSNELRKQCRRLEDRVSARKDEIEQAREAADLANAAKSHFLARVTHELRNPLNGIIGTATLCLEENNVEHIHNSLKTIFKCGELLLNLMVDLLSFSKTEVENLHLESRDFTLNEIISQLQVIFTEQCSARKIGLVVKNNEKFNNYIFSGDTNRILQVIFNLMSNGIKFTPEGGNVQLTADASSNDQLVTLLEDTDDEDEATDYFNFTGISSIEKTRNDGSLRGNSVQNSGGKKKRRIQHMCKILRFDVTDNGPGIAPDLQSRVFEEFVQGDISPHVKKSGVGLGLCICRQLAERMHGTVTLKSEVGHGSTFTFQLPLPYRVVDPQTPNEGGDDVLELTSYASMLRMADSQKESKSLGSSSQSKESGSSMCSTPDKSLSGGRQGNETDAERGTIKQSRNMPTSAQKARGFLLRRRTSDTISKSEDTAGEPDAPVQSTMRKFGFCKSEDKQTQATSSLRDNRDVKPPVQSSVVPQKELETHKLPQSNHNSQQQPSVNFPAFLAQRQDKIAPAQQNAPVPSRPPLANKNSYIGKPSPDLNVLVVDDNSVNQEVMMRMLNLEGLKNIKVANDGTEALDRVNEAKSEGTSFDVIFMDVQMPKMDGREATRIMRNELKMRVPIVAVSAFANETNAEDCINAGMNLFLSKPLRRPHLREILQSLSNMVEAKNASSTDESGSQTSETTESDPAPSS